MTKKELLEDCLETVTQCMVAWNVASILGLGVFAAKSAMMNGMIAMIYWGKDGT